MIIDNKSVILPLPADYLFQQKEAFWRIKLPSEFIDFLKANNGGRPLDGNFKCNNHEYVIDRFLCLLEVPRNNNQGMYDIDVTLTQIEDRLTDNEDLIGVEVLPIAVLFAGDFVCLDFRENKIRPSICVWDHEKSRELDPVTYSVANTFTEFINIVE